MVRAGFERLHTFLTAPERLTEDPTFLKLRERIAEARAAHQPTRGLQQALSDYVHACLRSPA